MEWEWPFSLHNGELNISISTSHVGLGFTLTINDFGCIWEINLLLLSIFYFTRGGKGR